MRFQIQDAAGAALGDSTLTADRGVSSAATAIRVANVGSTTAAPRLKAYEVLDDGSQVDSTTPALDGAWLEVRALDTGTGSGQAETDWTPLGTGRTLTLATLAAGEYHNAELRWSPTAAAQQGVADLRLVPEPVTPQTIAAAVAALPAGVVPIGSNRLLRGGVVTEGGGVGELDVAWLFASDADGEGVARAASTETADNTDGDAATLGVGESYWLRLVLRDGALVMLKGSKSVSPPVSAQPVPAAGDVLLALARRDEAGIVAGSVADERALWRAELEWTGGTLRVGAATYVVNGFFVEAFAMSSAPGDGTWTVWATSGGTQVATVQPEDGAMALWKVTITAGSVVATSARDLRRWWGSVREVRLPMADVVVNGMAVRSTVPGGTILPESVTVVAGSAPAGDAVSFALALEGSAVVTVSLPDGETVSSDRRRRELGAAAVEPAIVEAARDDVATVTATHGGSLVTAPEDVVVSFLVV